MGFQVRGMISILFTKPRLEGFCNCLDKMPDSLKDQEAQIVLRMLSVEGFQLTSQRFISPGVLITVSRKVIQGKGEENVLNQN